MQPPLMIAVSGGSGSGKTTFVSLLEASDVASSLLTLSQDHYYKDLSKLAPAARDKVNFDHPQAIDSDLLFYHLSQLAKGESIARPNYDFISHTRESHTTNLDPKPIILFDGIFSLLYEKFLPLFHLKIYLDVDDDIRLIRRLTRDQQQRGRTLTSVIEQYLSSVRPMHQQFIGPSKRHADLVIPWEEENRKVISLLTAFIREKLAQDQQ